MNPPNASDPTVLGVHCSAAGGVINAFDEAEKLGINAFQIFTKNQRQWKEKTIGEDEGRAFRARREAQGVKSVFSHAMYLINVASKNPELREKSLSGLVGELQRCESLGLDFTVLHPGSAVEQTREEAIERIAEGLRIALEATAGSKVKILLENMAGQGSTVGGKFSDLRAISDRGNNDRIGYCFDTCHAFAAGYDIRTTQGIKDTLAEWDQGIGIEHIACFHLNDSKHPLGSHKDRHENIGEGEIGEWFFARVINDERLAHLPMVLETPMGDDDLGHARDMERLRGLQG